VRQPAATHGGATDDAILELTMRMDAMIKTRRPDGWRGIQAREQVVRQAIFDVVQNMEIVEPMFMIVKQQPEY
jgi:type I restriction enzyme, R subunit